MKNLIDEIIKAAGWQLRRYPKGALKRRILLLKHFQINKIFDVGANAGNYAMLMRKLGFDGEIVSFEPLSETFKLLEKNAFKDVKWIVSNIALGDIDEETFINIAGNISSSSILEMLPSHLHGAPESAYIGKEKIKVHKLDSIIHEYHKEDDLIYLKIDTQGFEKKVLDGAQDSISKIRGIQVEMSLAHLYEGGILYQEMIELLREKGFELYSVEGGFFDLNSGKLLQLDGIFFRED